MRLYEFTDPSEYLLPETGTANLVKQSRNVNTADMTGDALRHQATKLETKKNKAFGRPIKPTHQTCYRFNQP